MKDPSEQPERIPDSSPPPAGGNLLLIEGTVERIIYTNPDTAYTIAGLRPKDSKIEITIVGNLGGLQPQEILRVQGTWIQDKRYGRQFKVEQYTSILPGSGAAIEKYLGSGLIKGIGKTYAKRLVSHFGTEIFDVIEDNPERLGEVDGIGKKRREQITSGWAEHRSIRDLMMFLQQYGLPQGFAPRIYKQYGSDALDQIKRNPYQLALDVRGIGFKSADAIAQKIGIPVESIERSKAGIHYLLQEMASDGHCFYPADPLIAKACEILGVAQALIIEAINALKAQNHIVLDVLPDNTRAVYLRHLHSHESAVAEHLVRLLNTGKLFPKLEVDKELADFESYFKFTLAENQRLAVKDALRGGVLVITGGPGTGKTTIIRAILRILEKSGVSTLLAAPTGRAAKRMHELTRVPASTIHRLLQFSPQEGKYLRNPQNPLRGDFLIIDEASMIDIGLANALLRAVASTSSVIFVGDVDQLPSVGPGNFLLDLIDSGSVPVVRLNEIFRQAQASLIVTNAHRINTGQQPTLNPPKDTDTTPRDFYFFETADPVQTLNTLLELVHHRIPGKFGLKPQTDIQVLSPMHRGVIGTQNLNREIQQVLNPSGQHLDRGGATFRVGDKVMQMSNNYDRDVFNGDIGFIASIDREDHLVKVNFDGRIVSYEFNDMDELELAYCISIHKSQGSEYKAVVIPIHTTHYVMLQRNLLYTAVTRGKQLVCLVGQRRAVSMAIANVSSEPRFSALDQRLRSLRSAHPSPHRL
ncbi:MAG: SF1B family DNA helicase RecD2 [Candidatus Sumerlaeaceae bacterium]